MISTSVSEFLSERLFEIDDAALVAVAARAGVDASTARRARAGEPVKASDLLRLFAARGYDPMTRKVIEPRRIGAFDHDVLRLFVQTQMRVRGHSVRDAAKAMDASPSAVQNMRQGIPVALGNVIKACAYLGIHPFEQCERVREEAA